MVRAVDLFCGAGGLSKGLETAGIEVTLGIDLDPACEYPYQVNNTSEFLLADVGEVPAATVRKNLGRDDYTLLAGCAPCQPFSRYSQGRKRYGSDKWKLLNRFASFVEIIQPTLVTMENVASLRNQYIFKKYLRNLKENNYHVSFQIVDCRQYGIPQTRKRLVLLASRLGDISLVKPTHPGEDKWRTVRDTIADLTPLKAGEVSDRDPLHRCSTLSDVNLRRMKASRRGGTWRDWPKALRVNCHGKATGENYVSVYGRMEWDAPSPTITTQCYGFGNGRFGHPKQNRAISMREAALLQSFPQGYRFLENEAEFIMRDIGRLIGNAVPPRLGEIIGRSILRHIKGVA